MQAILIGRNGTASQSTDSTSSLHRGLPKSLWSRMLNAFSFSPHSLIFQKVLECSSLAEATATTTLVEDAPSSANTQNLSKSLSWTKNELSFLQYFASRTVNFMFLEVMMEKMTCPSASDTASKRILGRVSMRCAKRETVEASYLLIESSSYLVEIISKRARLTPLRGMPLNSTDGLRSNWGLRSRYMTQLLSILAAPGCWYLEDR